MGAYAALLSLSHTLDQILFLDQYPHLLKKQDIVSLKGNVCTLLTFLEDYWRMYSGAVNPLENRIIDAAYQAEDMVEIQLLSPRPSAFKKMMLLCQSSNSNTEMEYHALHKALQEINFILEEAVKIQKTDQPEHTSVPDFSESAGSSAIIPSNNKTTVVLDDDFMLIKDRIYQDSSTFRVIPIFGMGGIGKTTLARRLYEDSIKMQWFDRCIWIAVSQDYSLRKILLGILQSMQKPADENCNDDELRNTVHRELFGRRYLLVADDIWSEEAWDILHRLLPKGTEENQVVLVTTRLQSVASYVGSTTSPPHEIQFLSEGHSWRLLDESVFGKETCPSELVQIGRNIAKCCHGLPLMIVVVAGLLKEDFTEAHWRRTLQQISSSARTEMAEYCYKVLSLSYDHLPLHLKPCFLYMTAFPEDFEVKVDRLVRLWMAEGFIRETGSKCLEEVAEGYLHDLVGRSLLIGYKNRYSGEIEAVKIHDCLRDIGLLKAREGRFHYHDGLTSRLDGKERRVTTHNSRPLDFSRFHDPAIRTYLNTGSKYLRVRINFQNHRLLRILYSPTEVIELNVEQMFLLRYVSIRCYYPPKSLFKLQNLHTLDIRSYSYGQEIHIPLKIWKMPFLRHVKVDRECYFVQPSVSDIVNETNLQTLSTARNLRITSQTVKMLANLRKLGLYYKDVDFCTRWNLRLHNLVHLQKLEELRITDFAKLKVWKSIWSSELKLPKTLKKLQLICVRIPWAYLDKVGLLPNLEVLRLRMAPRGQEWNPIEGRFLKLKCLKLEKVHLEDWVAERLHFPSLKVLLLKEMKGLMEIPSGIGEIDGLKLIELHDCRSSLVSSAKQIQTDQHDMGNEDLQVLVNQTFPSDEE